VQFQENIDQDQGKSEFLGKQIRDLEKTISDSRRRISLMEEGLKEYGELKRKMDINTSERRMLKKQKDEQYQALGEEITGWLLVDKIFGTSHCNNCKDGL
jgi:hypothetical protein